MFGSLGNEDGSLHLASLKNRKNQGSDPGVSWNVSGDDVKGKILIQTESGWWFQIFFIFTPIGGRFPF